MINLNHPKNPGAISYPADSRAYRLRCKCSFCIQGNSKICVQFVQKNACRARLSPMLAPPVLQVNELKNMFSHQTSSIFASGQLENERCVYVREASPRCANCRR